MSFLGIRLFGASELATYKAASASFRSSSVKLSLPGYIFLKILSTFPMKRKLR